MFHRIAFLPWTKEQMWALKRAYKANRDSTEDLNYQAEWSIVYRDTPDQPLGNLGYAVDTRIHVGGYGWLGSQRIFSNEQGDNPVSYKEVVQMLFEKGMSKNYLGTISCDISDSARGNPPFAQLLARQLWGSGVRAAWVLGYRGEFSPECSRTRGSKHLHQQVFLDHEWVKSSKGQQRFFGCL